MPRKPFDKQARYMFANRGNSYMLNQTIKYCKRDADTQYRYDDCHGDQGFFPRNPDMKPLIHNGRKAR